MERLQKVLSHAGVASRRAAEQLILEGRVTVNGAVITKLGTQVDPDRDAIKVDGRRIRRRAPQRTYLALNKPRGVLTTTSDPEGRPTIADLIPRGTPRVYPVGRLDFNSEGLILLTDDGDLARLLTHPRSRVEKVYRVKVHGVPEPRALERIRRGIHMDGRKTAPARVRIYRHGKNPWLEITVTEGRKHLVRKLLEAVGHRVTKLRRIRIGSLDVGGLPAGRVRRLTDDEVTRLRGTVSGPATPRSRSGGHRP
jgi:pseudouridine synthase